MKPLNSFFSRAGIIFFAVAMLVGVGGSIFLWQIMSPGHQIAQSKDPVKSRRTSTRVVPSTSSEILNLNKILEFESPTDRSIAIYALVDGMNGEQIRDLLNETLSLHASKSVQSVQTTLLEVLTWTDSTNALSFVQNIDPLRSDELVSTVFAEWAQFNLDDALQATSELNGGMKDRALWAIFLSRPDLTVSERVAHVEQHGGNPTLVQRLVTAASTQESLDQPLAALQTIVADEIDDTLQITVLYELTDYWYDRDGATSIGELLDHFYTWFQDEQSLLSDLASIVATYDPQTAWNHILTLPMEAQRKLASTIVSEWGATDFENAYQAVKEANVPSALGSLFHSLARSDPVRALAEVDQVPDEVAYIVYLQLVAQLPHDVILDHLAQHGRLGPNSATALRVFVESWSSQEPEDAVDWLLANSSNYEWINSDHLLQGLISLGSVDLERAFAIAMEQPKNKSATGMEYALIVELMRNGQLEGIEALLKQVREPKQFDGYQVLGMNLIKNGKFDEAIALGNQLPESKWREYFRQLTSTGIRMDSELFIEKLSLLPNNELRNDVARHIIGLIEMNFYPSRYSISDTDLRYLRSLITED